MENKNYTFLHAVKLWLIWNVLADLSLVIFIVGFVIMLFILTQGGHTQTVVLDDMQLIIVLLLLVLPNLIVGLIQWIAFIGRIKNSYWWILATALGWLVSEISLLLFVIYSFGYYEGNSIGFTLLAGAVVGTVIGLLQWLVLRGKVPGAGWWLLGSVLGWACEMYATYVIMQPGMGTMGEVVGASIMGIITGVAYTYLFTQSSEKRLSYPR